MFCSTFQYKGELDLAVDVGCGPGESTEILQPHFKRILGLDYSQSMIENAKKHNPFSNVEYRYLNAARRKILSSLF